MSVRADVEQMLKFYYPHLKFRFLSEWVYSFHSLDRDRNWTSSPVNSGFRYTPLNDDVGFIHICRPRLIAWHWRSKFGTEDQKRQAQEKRDKYKIDDPRAIRQIFLNLYGHKCYYCYKRFKPHTVNLMCVQNARQTVKFEL